MQKLNEIPQMPITHSSRRGSWSRSGLDTGHTGGFFGGLFGGFFDGDGGDCDGGDCDGGDCGD